MAKYDSLLQHLRAKNTPRVDMTFDQIAYIVGGLPRSAYKYDPWWANEAGATRHVQCRAWMDAGYRAEVNLGQQRVLFQKVA